MRTRPCSLAQEKSAAPKFIAEPQSRAPREETVGLSGQRLAPGHMSQLVTLETHVGEISF